VKDRERVGMALDESGDRKVETTEHLKKPPALEGLALSREWKVDEPTVDELAEDV
jgi:hypothetical protein